MSYYSRKFNQPFQEVLAQVTASLHQQGFGVITTINVKETFREKLQVDFRNYIILGACNPQFAYEAISLECHMGVMLPCNVVIQEHENGEVEVSAVNPLERLDKSLRITHLNELAAEVGNRLRAAIDNLHRATPDAHDEALPTQGAPSHYHSPLLG